MNRFVAKAAMIVLAAGSIIAAGSGTSAQAYGGDGKLNVYQLGISFNCNNRDFCDDELGGFWGWAELDEDPVTGAHTGDAEFAFCTHGPFNGAGHISVEITNWYTVDGILFTDEVDTTTFRGERTVETITGDNTGMPLVPGHYSTDEFLGFEAPPGVAIQIQIAYKPAH